MEMANGGLHDIVRALAKASSVSVLKLILLFLPVCVLSSPCGKISFTFESWKAHGGMLFACLF